MPILRLRILPPFPSVHFSRIIARIFSPPYWGSRRGLFHFSFLSHICGSFLPFGLFPSSPSPPSPFIRHFPFCIRQAWRIGNAASPSPCYLRPAIFALIFHFCRIFAAVFLSSPLLCPLRRDLIPTFFWNILGNFGQK